MEEQKRKYFEAKFCTDYSDRTERNDEQWRKQSNQERPGSHPPLSLGQLNKESSGGPEGIAHVGIQKNTEGWRFLARKSHKKS
jgi:hypothetical protein